MKKLALCAILICTGSILAINPNCYVWALAASQNEMPSADPFAAFPQASNPAGWYLKKDTTQEGNRYYAKENAHPVVDHATIAQLEENAKRHKQAKIKIAEHNRQLIEKHNLEISRTQMHPKTSLCNKK